ncbi:MAG: efflux RND transporter permease subunit [Dehalococcoidia bacterium]
MAAGPPGPFGGLPPASEPRGLVDRVIYFCLHNRLVVLMLAALVVGWGFYVMPFDPPIEGFPQDPIPVDAIPDIGENQQIVFTDWPGRSPQDVEDQVTYPLTISLQGVPGVKTIRSVSMFGFSSVFVIFKDEVEFYWARSRLLERLSVAQQSLPQGVVPALAPDATALGQVFWYTLEGEGFDLQELRSIQDWYVRYALQSTDGVAQVASVGGYVKEYQVDVDPDAMRAHRVALSDVMMALERSNIEVGAETLSWNGVEYTVRGKGWVKSVEDVENVVIKEVEGTPIYVRNVAEVGLGPALRRGMLDKGGAEAVGGVVIVRYGENPLAVIDRLKINIERLAPGLPRKTLPDGRVSQVEIVPFYDRTGLIEETLDTLQGALFEEILITIFVVLLFVRHFRAAGIICLNLPFAVLLAFVMMKQFHVDSNVMSLAGIAIAIGTMVDMGIILVENMLKHFDEAPPEADARDVIFRAASEVGGAVVTAIATTVVSFLPIFALQGPEGRLFKPLAYTKTFALLASILVALTILPTVAHIVFAKRRWKAQARWAVRLGVVGLGATVAISWTVWGGLALMAFGVYLCLEPLLPRRVLSVMPYAVSVLAGGYVLVLLTRHWMPLGIEEGMAHNLIFVFGINIAWTAVRLLFLDFYAPILRFLLAHKGVFLAGMAALVLFGVVVWQGWSKSMDFVPDAAEEVGYSGDAIRSSTYWVNASHRFPGIGREFMPPLDEGSFLWMPTTMPHASISEALDIVAKQDMAIGAIPEVETVVGKIGRAETPIDPAPVSMVETVITYVPEYGPPDEDGHRPRLWRDHIRSPDDIWREIVKAADVPGSTSAPRLMPIAARIVMLQTGMRAPMGIKVLGASLEEVEQAGYAIAEVVKEAPGVVPDSVIPDRVIGKPYLEIEIDRERIARYGVNIRDVQDVIETAIGGMAATTTVEGRERYPIRLRYQRELRDSVDALGRILVPSAAGAQVPLSQLSSIATVRGPQEIKSEDTFLVSYVLFDKQQGEGEVEVVERVKRLLDARVASGELELPAGVRYVFAGSYESEVRFRKRLSIVLPLALFVIFLILYLQFRSTPISLIVFSGIAVCWAGGFVLLWAAGQPGFLDVSVFGHNMRDVFNLEAYNLSVAVWVGFIALFGIATDDGVVMTTYLNQTFAREPVRGVADIRRNVVAAGRRRVRPCLMTTATTTLALLPVITAKGRGADVMVPMAMPILGGMTIELVTFFTVPVLYALLKEVLWKIGVRQGHFVTEAKAEDAGS